MGGGGWVWGGSGLGGGGQDRCGWKSEVFLKIEKKKQFFWGEGVGWGGVQVEGGEGSG